MLDRISRFFFQKRRAETDRAAAERELRSRGAPLRSLDPDRLASAIEGFRAGSLGPLARIVEELETRDDTMRSCSLKMRAAAARCPHQVLVREGVGASDRARAEAHRRALEAMWSRVRVTDALSRNARGGMRLLLKQMMGAQSMAFAAHELVWTPRPDGSLDLTCVHVPLQFFENRTGELRYLRDPSLWTGEEMAEGEWMVTAGDGVGIAAAIAATFKRLSLQDWLLFSERCGQPGLHASTDARQGSEQWENLVAAVANFGREWGIVTDTATRVNTVSLANGGTPPYPALVERMDRAIATLYRGSDLSTLSADGGSVGASQQGGEAEILEQDACEMLSETLQEQVERPFVRYVFGDDEPLAYIQVSPVSRPDLDMEMKIDQHLVSLGVALSKKEALERYQRTEASPDDPDDAALRQAQPPATGGFGLPNETPAPQKPRNGIANPLQNARKGSDGDLPPPAGETRQSASEAISRLADALGADMAPARDALLKLLDLPEAERPAAARELMGRLDSLMPADPAMAAVLAEEMAAAFAEGAGEVETQRHGDTEAVANSTDAHGNEHAPEGSPDGGRFVKKDGGGSADAEKGASGKPDRLERRRRRVAAEQLEERPVRTVPPFRKHPDSDKVAQNSGYRSLDDMLDRATRIPDGRVREILSAEVPARCTAAEGVAVLASRPVIEDKAGNLIEVGDNQIEKYCTGRFRSRNKKTGKPLGPKTGNFEVVPYMLQAVKSDKDASGPNRVKFAKGTTPDALNTPMGAQREYKINADSGPMRVFVYIKSTDNPKRGRINGWFVEGDSDGEP